MRLGEIGDDYAVVPELHVWTMDGGKAVAFQQHVDTIRVRELSWPPAPTDAT